MKIFDTFWKVILIVLAAIYLNIISNENQYKLAAFKECNNGYSLEICAKLLSR